MSLRSTGLLLLAAVLAFVAALNFRTAVHPEELSDPAPYEQFVAAAEQVPSLRAVRVHTSEPDVALRIRRASGGGDIRSITEVAALQAEMRRGRLAALPADRLEEFGRRLRAGEIPRTLPKVPDVRPYFEDTAGLYPADVLLRDAAGVDVLERGVPEAKLVGDPVQRREDDSRRPGVLRGTIAALVALLVAGIVRRSGRVSLEHRLLTVLVPLALLGWSGHGVDLWTVPAIVLVATVPIGSPLLAGAPLLLFPAMTLQRMGIVFLCGGLLRLWPRAKGAAVPPGGKGWIAAGLVALAGWVGVSAVPAPDSTRAVSTRGPALLLVPPGTRVAAAQELRREGYFDVVGGAEIPEGSADDVEVTRLLESIYFTAKSRARTASGDERAALESIREAAARDGVYVPLSLRRRRTAEDGRDLLWIHDTVDPADERFVSHALYRSRSEARLRDQSRLAAALVFALAVILRVLSRREHWARDLTVALVAFLIGASWLFAGDAAGWGGVAEPLLPTLALAGFAATWGFVGVLAAVALVLPGQFAVHLGAFILAACLRYLVRESDSDLIVGPE